jgi:tetratricopeptide (TPR) repeat protein
VYKSAQTTLSLASAKLAAAHETDPNAILELEGRIMDQSALRAVVLIDEALTWQGLSKITKAIGVAEEATRADPNHAFAWYLLGKLHYGQRNKADAISALEKSLLLNPDDIEAMKLLDRAHNLGDAEIIAYKAANARDQTLSAVAKTVETSKNIWRYALIGYFCFVGFAIFFTNPAAGIGHTFFPFVVAPFIFWFGYKFVLSYVKDWLNGG